MIEVAIFRVMQEALSNVHHHAAATQVNVMLEEHDNRLEFTVIDNGRGLGLDEFSRSRKNLGLARMVDYAELLNGRLQILSAPQQGTHVILSIPYPIL
jgi:two-component system sensor histidine kinase DegS